MSDAPAATPQVPELSLIENGVDFVREGIERYFLANEGKARVAKFSILQVYTGTLLILKERLRREHPSLIFTQVEDVGAIKQATVNVEKLLSRLNKVAQVRLNDDDIATINRAQVMRNQVEHYRVHINEQQAQSLLIEMIAFVEHFMKTELQLSLSEKLDREVWEHVAEIRRVSSRLADEDRARWEAVAVVYRNLTIMEVAAYTTMEEYHPKHNPDTLEFRQCGECDEETQLVVAPEVGLCTAPGCGSVERLYQCDRCSKSSSRGGLCSECKDELRDRE